MGEYIEEIGGWVDDYIFRPVWAAIRIIFMLIMGAAWACVPVAAIKYLFFS